MSLEVTVLDTVAKQLLCFCIYRFRCRHGRQNPHKGQHPEFRTELHAALFFFCETPMGRSEAAQIRRREVRQRKSNNEDPALLFGLEPNPERYRVFLELAVLGKSVSLIHSDPLNAQPCSVSLTALS